MGCWRFIFNGLRIHLFDHIRGWLLLLLLIFVLLVLLAFFSFLLLLVLSCVCLGVCHLFWIILILNAMDFVLVIGLACRVEPWSCKLLMSYLRFSCSLNSLDCVRLDSFDMLRRWVIKVVMLAWDVRDLTQRCRRCDGWDVSIIFILFLHRLGDYNIKNRYKMLRKVSKLG